MSYIDEFEKIQQMKLQLLKSNKMKDYSEDKDYFMIKSSKVKKEYYKLKKEEYDYLSNKRKDVLNEIASKQYLYIMSRSSKYETDLVELYNKKTQIEKEIKDIKEIASLFVKKNRKESDNVLNVKSVRKKSESISPSKRHKLKKFLFKTYEECSTRKTKEPFYMSKQDILDNIYENNEDLIKNLPKNFHKLGKKELCKVLFEL
jgi:hypothetical protein